MTTKAASLIGGLLARKGEAQPLGGDPLGRALSALRAAAPQRATIDTDSPLVFAPPPRAEPRRRAWPLPLIGALLAGLVAGALYASGEPPEAPAAAGAIIAWGHGGPAGPLPVTLAGPVSWPAVAPIGEPGRTKGHAPSPEAENVADDGCVRGNVVPVFGAWAKIIECIQHASIWSGAGLLGDGFSRLPNYFGIAEKLAADRIQRIIEIVKNRHAGRNVELGNVVVGDAVQHFYQSPQAIAVGCYQNILTSRKTRRDMSLPVGQDAFQCRFQGFGAR